MSYFEIQFYSKQEDLRHQWSGIVNFKSTYSNPLFITFETQPPSFIQAQSISLWSKGSTEKELFYFENEKMFNIFDQD